MIKDILNRLLNLDASREIVDWTFRFGSNWPMILLVLGIAAGLVAAIILYRRETTALGRFGCIWMAVVRTLAIATVLIMLFRPMAVVLIQQTTKPTVLVLVDKSASMEIRDARKSVSARAEAGIAMGKLPYDDPTLTRAVLRTIRIMGKAAAMESAPTEEFDAALAAVTKALSEVKRSAEQRSPALSSALLSSLSQLNDQQIKLRDSLGNTDRFTLATQQRSLMDALSKWKEEAINHGLSMTEETGADVSLISRRELVEKSLKSTARSVFKTLERQANLRWFRFAGGLEECASPWEESVESAMTATNATCLGSALTDAIARNEENPIGLIAVITDGANNGGIDPLEAARQLRRRDIPLVTVSVGLTHPDDAILRSIVVPDVVFANDMVTVRLHCRATGYERRSTPVVVRLDGIEVARKSINFTGADQMEEVKFRAGRNKGNQLLEVSLTPMPGEATLENNVLNQSLQVQDDKIKVLYIEGSPRWEFRYLRAVLKRDPRIDVKFITTEGDKDLARASIEHLGRFPETAEEAFKYDLVILGDVRANIFTPTQFGFIEQMVRERGASLIMLAGHKHTPGEYLDTPIAALLPVRFDQEPWGEVGDDVYPALTAAGRQSSVMTLDSLESRNQALWANVKPMFRVPPVTGAKPGAVVLAELSDRNQRAQSFPLIAWHRYGTGKCMFVGVDQLWRLRARTGDKYHLKFWGQAVQFLTLSRLLGENKMVRLETGRTHYAGGETVELFASVLDDAHEPLATPTFTTYVTPKDQDVPQLVTLKAVLNYPGMYTGVYVPPAPGRYIFSSETVEAGTASSLKSSKSSRVEFSVGERSIEQIETGMQQGLLTQMARITDGDALSLRELPLLADRMVERTSKVTYTRELDLWDNWVLLGLFVFLVSMEWAWRRNKNLA